MGVFEQFPYTNFHDLNLDWIIAELKKLDNKVNADLQDIIYAYVSTLYLAVNYDEGTETITLSII